MTTDELKTAWQNSTKCKWNHEHIETDTEWSHWYTDNELYLSFKGSRGQVFEDGKLTEDWKANIDIIPKSLGHILYTVCIARGILKKFRAIWPEVELLILNANLDGKTIELRGFSQGGALATIAAYMCSRKGYKYNAIVFGSPKVFWFMGKDKVSFAMRNLSRVEIDRDLAHRWPLSLFGYRHYGKCVRLKGRYPWWSVRKNHMSYGEVLNA